MRQPRSYQLTASFVPQNFRAVAPTGSNPSLYVLFQEKVVQLTSEIDLAERLHAERTQEADRRRQRLAGSRLRAKGTSTLDAA